MPYTLTYSYSNNAYTVIGYTGTPIDVIIPSTYNDGINGEHPVTAIGNYALRDCGSLTSVTIGNSVTSIDGGAFYNCTSLTNIIIPDSVTSIRWWAFRNCTSLTQVTISNGVTSIGNDAFNGCSSLASVTIGGAVTNIAESAFASCNNLETILLFPISVPTLASNAFTDTAEDIHFYCFSKSLDAYKSATNWNNYADKIIADDLRIYFTANADSAKKYIDSIEVGKQDKLTFDSAPTSGSTNPVTSDGIYKSVESIGSDIEKGVIVAGKSLISEQLENVSDESGSYQSNPFTFQATGTDNNTTETPTAPVAKHLELRGNTLLWNQLVREMNSTNFNTDSNRITIANGVASVVLDMEGGYDAYKGRLMSNFNPGLYTVLKGHRYYACFWAKFDADAKANFILRIRENNPNSNPQGEDGTFEVIIPDYWGMHNFASGEPVLVELISRSPTANCVGRLICLMTNSSTRADGTSLTGVTLDRWGFNIIDLTLLYGEGNEPTTIEEFHKDYPNPYYNYNPGQLLSCNSTSLKTIGYNQFNALDEFIKVLPNHIYRVAHDTATGLQPLTSGTIEEYDENKSLIKSTAYSSLVTIHSIDNTYPSNSDVGLMISNATDYVKIVNSSDTKILFNLAWDGNRTDYEDYWMRNYSLPEVELKSVPTHTYNNGHRESYSVVYDEYKPDGTKTIRIGSYTFTGLETWSIITKNIAIVNNSFILGKLTYTVHYDQSSFIDYVYCQIGSTEYQLAVTNNIFTFNGVPFEIDTVNSQLKVPTYVASNILPSNADYQSDRCILSGLAGFIAISEDELVSNPNIETFSMAVRGNKDIVIGYNLYTNISSLIGQTINYVLAASTTTTGGQTFQENIEVDDFGTMEFVPTNNTTPVTPQGNQFFYPADYVLLIDDLNSYVNGDVDNLAKKSDLSDFVVKNSTVTDLISSSKIVDLSVNTRYNFATLNSLDITFPTIANDGDEITINFVSGSTATTLTRDTTNAIYNFSTISSNVFVELNAEYKVSISKWVVISAETGYTA